MGAARVHRVDRDHHQLALLRFAIDPRRGRRDGEAQPPLERAHVGPPAADHPAPHHLAPHALQHPHHDTLANAVGARPLARLFEPD